MPAKPSPRSLARLMRRPARFHQLTPAARDALLRLAGRANLTASLAAQLPPGELPADVRDRLEGATVLADEHARRLRWELKQLAPVVAPLGVPVVVLKGGAYLHAGLRSAQGRVVSDLDLLVPRADLERTEAAMRAAGYLPYERDQDDYDERYYREWMHEVPPLVHPARGTVVDLHHNIAPPVSRLKIDPALLLADAVPLTEAPGFLRLGDHDLVLHLCVHMFQDGELDNGLRELLDLHGMLETFGEQPAFWDGLLARAERLGATRPLYHGVRSCRSLLDTDVPDAAWRRIAAHAPPAPQRAVLAWAMDLAILPEPGSRPGVWRSLASGLLFLRAHWLRMPPGLLLRHLATQVRRRGGLKTKHA